MCLLCLIWGQADRCQCLTEAKRRLKHWVFHLLLVANYVVLVDFKILLNVLALQDTSYAGN